MLISVAGPHRPEFTILVADESRQIRWLLRYLFEDLGHRVVTANDGQEALALIRLERPDACLLDLDAPASNGLDVIQAMRSDPKLHHIPVGLMTTRAALLSNEVSGLDSTRILDKPLIWDDILDFIASSQNPT